jgi:hypothetical protein
MSRDTSRDASRDASRDMSRDASRVADTSMDASTDTSTVRDAQLAALLELGFAPEGLAPFCDGISPMEAVVERVMAAQAR